MVGEFEDEAYKGIIPRSFDYLFEKIQQLHEKERHTYVVSIAFIQIYLETVQDLFNLKSQVKIRGDKETGVYLENATWIRVNSTNECADAFKKGEKNRKTESTRMNAHSSRSHALLIAKIEKTFIDQQSQEHVMTRGMLYLVDLAGSERVHKTKAQEMRLEEAKKINFSLLTLGNCINALIEPKSTHIPYRNSKLTRILQDSLGGNAKTSLIVNISPSTYNTEETISSLNFGLRAMSVQNKPIINEAEDYQAQCQKLQEDYDKLAEEYNKLKNVYDEVVVENEKFKNGETYLELQKKSMCSQFSRNSSSGNISLSKEELANEIEKIKEEMNNYMTYADNALQEKEMEIEKATKESRILINKKDKKIEYLNNQVKLLYEENQKYQIECNDKSKDLEDLQLSIQNIQQQKEEIEKTLTSEILKQKEELEQTKCRIQELNSINNINGGSCSSSSKNSSLMKSKSSQTETMLNQQLKEALIKLNISKENITWSNYDKILNELIITTETALTDASKGTVQSKKYTEIINDKSEEINALQEQNKSLSFKLEEQYNKIKELEETILHYKQQQQQQQQQCDILLYENESSEIDIKKLQYNLNTQSKDISYMNKYIKDIKKVETLFEKDLTSKKNVEQLSNKLEKKIKNMKISLDEYINNNHNNSDNNGKQSIKSSSQKLFVDKFEEQVNENKKHSLYLMNAYIKLCELFYYYLNNNNNEIPSIIDKDEQLYRSDLLLLIENMIDNFYTYCPNNNVDDLKKMLNKQKNTINSNDITSFVENAFQIIEKLFIKLASAKAENDLEIQNLNEKLIYFLRELAIFKNNRKSNQNVGRSKSPFNYNNSNDTIEERLSLKEEEVCRLRKDIDKYLILIQQKDEEINALKFKRVGISQTKDEYMEESDFIMKGISDIKGEFNVLKQDKVNEEVVPEESKKKNHHFRDKIKKKEKNKV